MDFIQNINKKKIIIIRIRNRKTYENLKKRASEWMTKSKRVERRETSLIIKNDLAIDDARWLILPSLAWSSCVVHKYYYPFGESIKINWIK